ncbi:MAG: FHA domain-containing protein [Chloroflexi bacterium]|nr:FHA domain-containing protein [Chloroflexota bacterium]
MGYFLRDSEKNLIPVGLSMRIGSDPGADIVIRDKDVSDCHAIIGTFPDCLLIRDEESQSGTFVNDEKITRVTALVSGDQIRIGKTKFIVYHDDAEM